MTNSVREVEVVVGVVIVLALAEERSDEVEREGDPGKSEPHSEHEVAHVSLDEEALGATVQEMEEPLLRSVRSVMPDVTTGVGGLLVEILLTVPGSPLLAGHAESLAVTKAHVLSVSVLVVSQSTSYTTEQNKLSIFVYTPLLTFCVHDDVLYLILI